MHTYCNHNNNSHSLISHSSKTIYSLTYSLRNTTVLRLIAIGMMYPKSCRCRSGAWKSLNIFWFFVFAFTNLNCNVHWLLITLTKLFAITVALLGLLTVEVCELSIWCTRKAEIWVWPYFLAIVTLSKSENFVTLTSRQVSKNSLGKAKTQGILNICLSPWACL